MIFCTVAIGKLSHVNLVQYGNISFASHILLLFTRPKAGKITQQNMRNSENASNIRLRTVR